MRRLMLIGAPRSGTTWLSKLIDANPTVQFLHEPDSLVYTQAVPPILHDEVPDDALLEATRRHVDALFSVCTLKTLSVAPLFKKSYRNPAQHATLQAALLALRTLEQLKQTRSFSRHYRLPTALTKSGAAPVTLVKSVLAGRARLAALALPEIQFFLVGRDPRGFVASIRTGARLGRIQLAGLIAFNQLSKSPEAKRRGMTEKALQALPPVAQLTWSWLMLNEQIMRAARAPNTMLISYDRFCLQPESALLEMMRFADLDMSKEVQRYLADSTAGSEKKSRYFSLKQDPVAACQRWKQQLTVAECREIERIVRDTESAHFLVDD